MYHTLRDYQQETVNAIANFDGNVGRVVLPTGAGKTLVEATIIRDRINRDDECRVHLVIAPRIVLVNQLIKEYRDAIGHDYIAYAFHSGKREPDFAKVPWSEESGTRRDDVVEQAKRALRMSRDLIVFSTYASVGRLRGIKFDTIIADESQYCVSENTFGDVKVLTANLKLFFTATERHTASSEGRGLNNEEVFGPLIKSIEPSRLIKSNYLVKPRVHVVTAEADSDKSTVVDEALHIAKAQVELSKDMPYKKILFACKGTDDVVNVSKNVEKIKKEMPGFTVFTIVSNTKYGAMVDGVKTARGNFMHAMRTAENALIFHYDILAEGIDIDGITGVGILRTMNQAKLLQTIGRAVRIYKANPELKKQAWVSVVNINDKRDNVEFISSIVAAMRDGNFDVNVEDISVTDTLGRGIHEDEDFSALDRLKPERRNALLKNVEHTVEKWEADFEAAQSLDKAKAYVLDLMKKMEA
jgi:hypothetical protein